jgi:hypothetical protein
MKSRATTLWFVFAAALAAFIWFYQLYLRPAPPVIVPLLPGFHAADATGLQVIPAGAREISAVRTGGGWQLVKPLAYPAQATAIEALAGALEKLVPAARLTAAELRAHPNADAEFGFDNPQFSVLVESGSQRRQLLVGHKTAPGDQVFIRVVGVDGVFVTDAGWLQWLPRAADVWRDTALLGDVGACNWIIVTNGAKVLEFRRDATNQLWRMIRPLAARADGTRLAAALQQLRGGNASRFVTDDPRADLSGYGLQPADLSVWLGAGANLTAGVEAGKAVPDNPALVFARRAGWNAVVAVNKDAFAGWRGAVNDYRDSHLLTFTSPVAEIDVGGETPFTLQPRGSNDWIVAGETFPADRENVQAFLKLLADFRVEFVKDGVTAPVLQGYGFTPPTREITLRGAAGDTNSVLAQLQFGATDTNQNRVFVKRADEDYIYALKPADVARLPEHGWEFRDRRVWNFSETNVAQVTLKQNGKTRVLIRTGENKWSLGSQGILDNPPAVEETVHRLGELTVLGRWVDRGVSDADALKKYALNPANLQLTVELKTGEKLSLAFGAELTPANTALAAVTYGNERWVFIFPPVLYQYVATYLTIPPNAP